MRPHIRYKLLCTSVSLAALIGLAWSAPGLSYPGGPVNDVTDAAPFCAGCHASLGSHQLRDLPSAMAARQLASSHIAAIKAGKGNYAKLTPAQRTQLVDAVEEVDNNASVTLKVPAKIRAGHLFTATVEAKGGSGPVDGIMLLDYDLRDQARPAPSDGFLITAPPKVIGPDGKPQDTWIKRRYDGLSRNLEFVLVYGVKADLAAHKFASSQVTYRVQAPLKPGKYTLAAALLFGTETASPVGRVSMHGRVLPVGGFDSASGRILFTDLKTITVEK